VFMKGQIKILTVIQLQPSPMFVCMSRTYYCHNKGAEAARFEPFTSAVILCRAVFRQRDPTCIKVYSCAAYEG